jgi:DNA transformation protein
MKNEFVAHIIDLLSPYGSIKARAMFGGYGIYKNDLIVGIIIQDELYFKVDAESTKAYENKESKPFSYESNGKKIKMSYWQVPPEIMEDQALLGDWLEGAYNVSLKAKSRKK